MTPREVGERGKMERTGHTPLLESPVGAVPEQRSCHWRKVSTSVAPTGKIGAFTVSVLL